ncbi:hypothetical protein [Akkermansia massiliensis]
MKSADFKSGICLSGKKRSSSMMVNNLHDSKLSFHAALRKTCHLYIQPQVSDPHEKILIRH